MYVDVCKNRPGNDRFVEKTMQTINGAAKNKEVQCDKIIMEDKGKLWPCRNYPAKGSKSKQSPIYNTVPLPVGFYAILFTLRSWNVKGHSFPFLSPNFSVSVSICHNAKKKTFVLTFKILREAESCGSLLVKCNLTKCSSSRLWDNRRGISRLWIWVLRFASLYVGGQRKLWGMLFQTFLCSLLEKELKRRQYIKRGSKINSNLVWKCIFPFCVPSAAAGLIPTHVWRASHTQTRLLPDSVLKPLCQTLGCTA